MKAFCAGFFAVTLAVSCAFAAAEPVSPLPSGKPAGTKQAALLGPSFMLILLSAGIVIGGISLAVSNNGNGGVTTPTTTATSTTALP